MIRTIYATASFLMASCLYSCVSPVEVGVKDQINKLVVEGFISTDYGPHEIIVSRTVKFTSRINGGSIKFERNVEVYITDQDGVRTNLRQHVVTRRTAEISTDPCGGVWYDVKAPTHYLTPKSFKGKVGNTYVLHIIDEKGQHYSSEPQTILPPIKIDSLSLKFKKLPSTNDLKFESGVEVWSAWQDPPGEKNYYFWRVNGVYKISTIPIDGHCCVYDPVDDGDFTCWIVEDNLEGNELAYSDEQSDGHNITSPIGFVKDNGVRFANLSAGRDKIYHVEVEQYTIPEKAYLFHRLVKSQLAVGDGIFAPPPAKVDGNIKNVNDADEEVIGYFGAYSVSKKGKFVHRDLMEELQVWPSICSDCRVLKDAIPQENIPEPYRE